MKVVKRPPRKTAELLTITQLTSDKGPRSTLYNSEKEIERKQNKVFQPGSRRSSTAYKLAEWRGVIEDTLSHNHSNKIIDTVLDTAIHFPTTPQPNRH